MRVETKLKAAKLFENAKMTIYEKEKRNASV